MLQSLADKLKTAGQPVTLNAVFIQSAGVTPPTGFDANLKAAFCLADTAAGLQITFDPSNVGNISNNQFQVSNARLAQDFLNAKSAQTNCLLTFSQADDQSPVQVQIETTMSNWKFTDKFTFMTDFPFSLLPFSNQSFIFSTNALKAYQVRGISQLISLSQGQNYVANFQVPPEFQPLFGLINGFNPPTSATIAGSIVLNKADNEKILYPDMDMRATLSTGKVTILGFMSAFNPFIGLQIKTVEETTDEDGNLLLTTGDDDDTKEYSQTPFLYLGVYLQIGDVNGKNLLLDFAAAKSITNSNYGFSLNVDPESNIQLTPATVIGLMVGQSYFALVPPELQQFLTKIGLQGLAVAGTIKPLTISSLSVSIGTSSIQANQSPINFTDPTNNQAFTLKEFNIAWVILNPLDSVNRIQLVTISSSFTLFPNVFKNSDGTPGGIFEVTLDQDLNIDGKFNGTASFDDLLKAITGGYVGLPNGVEASFSDVYFQLNPKVKSYSFGLTLNAEFNLIQTTSNGNTQPLIQFQDFELQLSASTPTASTSNGNTATNGAAAKTVYDATINGTLNIGALKNPDGSFSPALSLNAFVEFDGTKQPSVWTLKTSLAQPLKISQLLNQFFASFDIKNFPDFLPGDLSVTAFSVEATIPSKSSKSEMLLPDGNSLILADGDTTNQPTYKIAGKMQWVLKNLPFGSNGELTIAAEVGLQYDGNKVQGQQFSGSVIGSVTIDNSFQLMVGYSFGPLPASSQTLLLTSGDEQYEQPDAVLADQPTNSQTLWVQWNGLRAEYKFADQTLTFRLTGWTVGKLLQELVRMIDNPYFTLSSPWDFLNQISLDGLSVTFDFKAKSEGKSWIYASYSLPKPVELGFMTLKGIVFQRTKDGKVTLALDADVRIPGWDTKPLFNPKGDGQNVKEMPTPTGGGNAYFDVRFLALGQRIGIVGSETFESVQAVFTALEKIPSSQSGSNPVNPTTSTPGQPYYNANNNWLIAFDFGLLRIGETKVYTFDCKVVFNDPNLYGLRLALSGDKAKVLAGLVIDILYKKVTDDVGVYQIDFSFPSILRTLNFGAFTITLPSIQIKIYTNGDFFFDFGFPYNLDFSRSFSIAAIIPPGIPVMGSAGFYFGKLSSATATQVPQTTKGLFNPVIIFGIGLQLGVGYSINAGILQAGFSITVFGIVEGVIAAFNPYSLTDGSDGSLQKDYYFKLQGTIGLIGKLYGTVDFVIIKGSVELLIQVYVQATYESYRAIPLVIAAHVSVKVSLTIDLWLFSITISFSFAMTVKAQVTIGHDEIQNAPWYDGNKSFLTGNRPALTRERLMMLQSPPDLRFKSFVRSNAVNPTLTLVAAPQFTVHQPDINDPNPANQKGAFVLLLAMDAPTADSTGNLDGSSFESLCQDLLPWVIDALKNPDTENAFALEAFAGESVSKSELDQIMSRLSDTSAPAISADDIMTKFLQPNFTINVELSSAQNKTKLQSGSTIFPPLSGFSVTFPDPHGEVGKTSTIIFDRYVTITETYRQKAAEELAKLAAQVSAETNGQNTDKSLLADDPEPFAKFVFEDYFLSIARQLIQYASDTLDDFDFPISAKPAMPPVGDTTDSLQSIFDWLTQRGNSHIQFTDIAAPNLTKSLTGGNSLVLSGINYTVQKNDTLQSISSRYSDSSAGKRWTTSCANIIIANQTLNTLILPNVKLSINNGGNLITLYTTQIGDSFKSIAAAVKMSVEALANQQSLCDLANFIAPSVQITVPNIQYMTAGTDTLQSIMTVFSISLDAILSNQTNRNCAYLFDGTQSASINIANLESLNVSDLWAIIKTKHQIGQIAGMVARYQLHGMRMPNLDGLALPEKFTYPAGQSDYGIYQLTGQQFPAPPLSATPDYSISLGKDSTLSWVQFNGNPETDSLTIPLSNNSSSGNASQAAQLFYLLQYAQGNVYNPNPIVAVQADAVVNPKRQAVKSATKWSTSDQQKLISITAPPATVTSSVLAESQQPQTQPILWQLPEGVLKDAEDREAKLSANSNFKFTDIINYLPVYQPQIGTTDPATHTTEFSPANNYAFSTRVDFQIKRLAQQDDQAPQTPLANDIIPPDSGISGSPAKELAPFTYELIGPNPSDALMLERLLTAMDSLGEKIISGLFMLYPDSAVATSGLVSRADSEFLSFITQTNLSTETNPPPMFFDAIAETQLNGIGNSPADFIKMMWELSTVRSGGYYLYYEVIGQGVGLPETLFDDSGAATLTLVIAYNRKDQPTCGGRITDYVNSFVTTDAIDVQRSVMTLESQSSPDKTKPLTGTESLQNISDHYGVEVGLLAELNAQIPMSDNIQIPIGGIARQITPADVSAGNVLETLAKYYSAGAAQPISATDIGNFNPDVQPTVYSVFRIPPVTYVVGSANAGSTFNSVQNYYNLSLDTIAGLARNVAGIFKQTTPLNTDSISHDVKPALGSGNIGVEITRANPGDPPDLPVNPTAQQIAAFANGYLSSLYSLLTAGLYKNAFFNPSSPGIPFGPRKPLSSEEAAAIRQPQARRKLLTAQAVEDFDYSQAIGFSIFSTKDACPNLPQSENELLPINPPNSKSPNPYIGVGTIAQVNLQWADVFGNRIVNTFTDSSDNRSGALNNIPIKIDYVDRLIGIGEWTNVRTYYSYSGTSANPVLSVKLELQTAGYQPPLESLHPLNQLAVTDIPAWQQNAINDEKKFTSVYFQLNQNYDNLNIPGISGNAVSMYLTNTLLADKKTRLSSNDEQSIRQFVADCLVYITKRANNQDGGTQPSCRLQIPVSISQISADDIIELSLALTLERQSELCDSSLRAIEGGTSATTEIKPLMDAPSTNKGDKQESKSSSGDNPNPQNLVYFANTFEPIFQTGDWQMLVGSSAPDPSAPRGSQTPTIWAVRMGKKQGVGFYYEIGDQASFYAPKPIAQTLETATASINNYTSGKSYPDGDSVSKTFTGVDLNSWANTALAAIDTFLAPNFANSAFIVDSLLVSDPEKDGCLAKILQHKQTLSGAIAQTTIPILNTSANDYFSLSAAREKLRQSLLNRLSNAFITTAITVFSASNVSVNPPTENEVSPTRFYGQPQKYREGGEDSAKLPTADSDKAELNYSLTTGKIQYFPLATGNAGEWRLPFIFSSKNIKEQTFVSLLLGYALTHLECNITNVPGIENYEQSTWIQFVNPPLNNAVGKINNNELVPTEFPVVLRALPTPPSITAQTAAPVSQTLKIDFASALPSDLADWNYSLSYEYNNSAQDSMTTVITLNSQNTLLTGDEDQSILFTPLAQFVSVYNDIFKDFEAFLRKVNASSKPTDTNVLNAQIALDAFEKIVGAFATAYDQWANPSDTDLLFGSGSITQVTYTFDIVLADGKDGNARIDVLKEKILPLGQTLPPPLIQIKPTVYKRVDAPDKPADALVSYNYELITSPNSEPATYLSYKDALAIPDRTIALDELNVFNLQNGLAEIQVLRNEYLLPENTIKTNAEFQFGTPQVKFANSAIPSLDYPSFDLGTLEAAPPTLDAYLNTFFDSLFKDVSGISVLVKMTGVFSYNLLPEISDFPDTNIPIALLPPIEVTPKPGQPLPVVEPFTNAVTDWIKSTKPVINSSSKLSFKLEIFAGSSNQSLQMPLLSIGRLFIDAEKLKFD